MLTKRLEVQDELIISTLEELVPNDHLVRKLDQIDFTFIHEKVSSLYSESNGRPSIDPVILFKILTIKSIFNIRSIRQTMKEIEVNVAYRWFLRIPMSEKIPHHTVISKNIHKRYKNTQVIESIFKTIIQQCIELRIPIEREMNLNEFNLTIKKNKARIKEESLYEMTLV